MKTSFCKIFFEKKIYIHSRFNGPTTSEFKSIIPVLKGFLFSQNDIKEKIEEFFKEKNCDFLVKKDEDLIQIINKILSHFDEIYKNLQQALSLKSQEIEQANLKINNYLKENQEQKVKLQRVHNDLKIFYQEDLERKETKIHHLEEQISSLCSENKFQIEDFNQKIKEMEAIKEHDLMEYNKSLQNLIDEKEMVEKSKAMQAKELSDLKIIFGKLSLNHKTLLSCVKGIKEKQMNNEKTISNLINENQKLKIRAAVAWEEMTPRPSFENVLPF